MKASRRRAGNACRAHHRVRAGEREGDDSDVARRDGRGGSTGGSNGVFFSPLVRRVRRARSRSPATRRAGVGSFDRCARGTRENGGSVVVVRFIRFVSFARRTRRLSAASADATNRSHPSRTISARSVRRRTRDRVAVDRSVATPTWTRTTGEEDAREGGETRARDSDLWDRFGGSGLENLCTQVGKSDRAWVDDG